MTNDLNNIPTSVCDALEAIKANDTSSLFSYDLESGEETRRAGLVPKELADQALPLIERLCQPNIVIVDLDDEKLVERVARAIPIANGHESEVDDELHMANHRATAKAALAALKEK